METMFLVLWTLYRTFFVIGMFGFGGGLAMLPYIEKQVVDVNQWLTPNEFLDLLSISQSTPGPISINSATFVGYQVAGILGSLVSTIGLVSFSIILVFFFAKYLDDLSENEKTKNLFKTLLPITIGFIFAAAVNTSMKVWLTPQIVVLSVVAFIILWSKKLHPITIVLGFGLAGIVYQFITIY